MFLDKREDVGSFRGSNHLHRWEAFGDQAPPLGGIFRAVLLHFGSVVYLREIDFFEFAEVDFGEDGRGVSLGKPLHAVAPKKLLAALGFLLNVLAA